MDCVFTLLPSPAFGFETPWRCDSYPRILEIDPILISTRSFTSDEGQSSDGLEVRKIQVSNSQKECLCIHTLVCRLLGYIPGLGVIGGVIHIIEGMELYADNSFNPDEGFPEEFYSSDYCRYQRHLAIRHILRGGGEILCLGPIFLIIDIAKTCFDTFLVFGCCASAISEETDSENTTDSSENTTDYESTTDSQ